MCITRIGGLMATESHGHNHLEWQFLYENAACGYLSLSPTLEITRINATALTWLGLDRAGFTLPQAISTVMDDTDVKVQIDRYTQLGSAQAPAENAVPVSFHGQLKRQNGSRFPALFHLSLDTQASDSYHLAIFHLHQFEDLVETLTQSNAQLRDEEKEQTWRARRLGAIIEAITDAIISIDHNHKITYANPAAWKLFRTNLDDLLGKPLDSLIPERFRATHGQHISAFGKSGVTSREMAGSLAVTGLRGDGTEFPLEASISQITADDKPVFTVILRDITLRMTAENELLQTREQLRQLTSRLRSVREEEQRHVARELHDDVGQRLSALRMDVAALRDGMPTDQPSLFDIIENMDELVNTTVVAVRRLATGLRPKILDELGLAPALETFLQDIQSRFGITFEVDIDESIALPNEHPIVMFRIVQEAVHNIVKHSQASKALISLQRQDQQWRLAIRDNGQGMNTEDEQKPNSLGLVGMRERVTGVGGEMKIRSAPNQGMLIECFFPVVEMPLHED